MHNQKQHLHCFLNQLYFKIVDEEKKDYHIFFKMENKKIDRPEILDVVNGDYDRLYDDITTPSKLII